VLVRRATFEQFPPHWAPSSWLVNHGSVIGAPVAPHVAGLEPVEAAPQTAEAATVTRVTVAGRTATEAARKGIAAETEIAAPIAAVTAAARKRRGGKLGTSENEGNCKNNNRLS
jgi:hypothetical protein